MRKVIALSLAMITLTGCGRFIDTSPRKWHGLYSKKRFYQDPEIFLGVSMDHGYVSKKENFTDWTMPDDAVFDTVDFKSSVRACEDAMADEELNGWAFTSSNSEWLGGCAVFLPLNEYVSRKVKEYFAPLLEGR